MHVPEDHSQPDGQTITFPVLIFRNPKPIPGRPPLIHLGAGGPGASMYLDYEFSVKTIWQESRKLWLDQGRDFIVMDPRGAGLAKPLLNCDLFAEQLIPQLQKNLSLKAAYDFYDQTHLQCIQRFKQAGIQLNTYNSLSVAQDVEALRKALGVKQWVLYGISHASIYAQLVASEYPDTVSSMILDSAAFPNLKPHHHFPAYELSFYETLYNYCDKSVKCATPIDNFKQRFWALYSKLMEKPLKVRRLPHPDDPDKTISIPLNGNLFVATLLYGLYGTEIFDRIPGIIIRLEKNDTDALHYDLSWYLAYLMDNAFGGVSSTAHHCYETVPFTDYDLIKQTNQQLPAGYIRENARLAQDWHDICQQIDIGKSDPKVAQASKTDIPTLFLHGKLDTVTPLKHVREQLSGFSNSQLRVYPLSHGVLGVDECADEAAAAFLLDPEADLDGVKCE